MSRPVRLTFTARDAAHARRILEAVEPVLAEDDEKPPPPITDLDVERVRRVTRENMRRKGRL